MYFMYIVLLLRWLLSLFQNHSLKTALGPLNYYIIIK